MGFRYTTQFVSKSWQLSSELVASKILNEVNHASSEMIPKSMSEMVMHPLIERIKNHQENTSNKQVFEEISFTQIESYQRKNHRTWRCEVFDKPTRKLLKRDMTDNVCVFMYRNVQNDMIWLTIHIIWIRTIHHLHNHITTHVCIFISIQRKIDMYLTLIQCLCRSKLEPRKRKAMRNQWVQSLDGKKLLKLIQVGR